MLTDFLENKLLNLLFNRSVWSGKPTNLYFALFTVTPSDDGTGGIEVSGSGYARAVVAVDPANWTIASGTATNVNAITWNVATASWGGVVSVGIYTASTGGTLLAIIPLTAAVTVDQYNQFKFDASGLSLSIAGAVSTYAANALLAHWLEGTAMPSIPTIYAALCTGVSADGVVEGEPMVYGYERKPITNSAGNFPAAVAGSKSINNTHSFLANGTYASWPQVSQLALTTSFWGQRLAQTVSSNYLSPSSAANLFQNGDRVVFIAADSRTTTIDGAGLLFPHRVMFVRDRSAIAFKVASTSGGAALAITTPASSAQASTAYLCDAASLAVTATGSDPNLDSTAHGLKVGDILAFCPNDFASPGSTTYPTTLALNTSPTAAQEIRFVVSVPDADTFQLSATLGGAALTPGTSQSFSMCRLNPGEVIYSGDMTNALTIAISDTAQILDDSYTLTLD
jgi:hypothetical protein